MKFLHRISELFPASRILQAALDEAYRETEQLSTEKLILQDRLEQALNDRARVWDLMKDALQSKDQALYTQINILMQEKYGIALHPEAGKLPESRVPQLQQSGPVSHRMTGADAVARQTANFAQEVRKRAKDALEKK